MSLETYIPVGCLLTHLEAADKREAVASLVRAVSRAIGLPDTEPLVLQVLEREAAGDTSVGMGVAIPHVRTRLVPRPVLAVATLERPLSAEDDADPVDVLMLILGPEQDPRAMLRLLARVVRRVKTPGFLTAVRTAPTPDALRSALSGEPEER